MHLALVAYLLQYLSFHFFSEHYSKASVFVVVSKAYYPKHFSSLQHLLLNLLTLLLS